MDWKFRQDAPIYSQIIEEADAVGRVRRELASERLNEFTAFMNRLGYTGEDIIELIKEGEKPNGNS